MQNELAGSVEVAIKAAFAAGREILAVYGTDFSAEQKADRSPLTEADKRAHRVIVSILESTGLPVLSEEGKTLSLAERQGWQRYWLVDPLDGTKEFIKRNGEFTVNIALMERDALPAGPLGMARPIAGVLYVPVKDTLYFAWQGGGAYRLQEAGTHLATDAYERASMSERLPLKHDRTMYTVVASRSHPSPETEAYIRKMEAEHGEVALTSMGSALKICLVAEGAADAYPRYAPTMEWDTAAGHAIVNESGMRLIDITTGAPMRYNKNELVNNWFIVH
ncbi:MAG: 3'(2'),5'-bisphosphate nucleotidase CysQ [Flavobacteriales bacterium]|nr:3'(2'),5'-bisphosphate nucleotidase CysQ [Flavobacteriales bacterium]MCC6938045.1 3'(2'),5'-bisphosphate nucleotidase CysQ [Flavobacteriales bacterium]